MHQTLQQRFELACTIKGTRGFHYFKAISSTKLAMKRTSQDEEFSFEVNLELAPVSDDFLQSLKENEFLCVVYDKMWYIGVIKEVDNCNSDVLLDFMHPGGPSRTRTFHWPQKRDVCWVPCPHVLCKVDVPSRATTRGQYYLSKPSTKKIDVAWQKFKA